MALGGSQKESLTKNLSTVTCISDESRNRDDNNLLKIEHLTFSYQKKQDDIVNSTKINTDDIVCTKIDDRKLSDIVDNVFEKNMDDINQSSDSLSSSASISDSDLTSTDSDDSLALSESESITDVTPLNSPYCDSPLPQSRHIEYKSEEKNLTNPCRNVDSDVTGDNHKRPEMNVLMKAIEKLELEAKNNSEFGFRETIMRRRAASFSSEEAKRIEQENQRLFKRVISQQNRIRSIYSSNQPSSKSSLFKNQDLVKSDGDISGTPKKSVGVKFPKQPDKSQVHRRQKCLSHPSSFIYSCNHRVDKNLVSDVLSSEISGKKKYVSPGVKVAGTPKVENSCEEITASSVEME